MKKITLLLGAGVGFVAGSKAGNGPYQQLEAKVRELMKRPSGTEAGSDQTPPLTGNGTADTVTDGGVVLPTGAEL
jgi:hypothetical protein